MMSENFWKRGNLIIIFHLLNLKIEYNYHYEIEYGYQEKKYQMVILIFRMVDRDGIYHKIKLYEDYFDCQDVLVDDFEEFYFSNQRKQLILGLSEEYFAALNKALNDFVFSKCVIHLNWLVEPYVYDDTEIKRLNNFLYEKKYLGIMFYLHQIIFQ